MSVQLARRLFTVHEYDQMGQAGILSEDDRVELLDREGHPLGSLTDILPLVNHLYVVNHWR